MLKLFSPPSFNKLPGWSYPSPKGGPDTKDEMADYLAAYEAFAIWRDYIL